MAWANALDRMARRIRDTFPTSAAYRHGPSGTPYAVTLVFDEAHRVWDPDMPGVSTTECIATVRIADLTTPPAAYDRITIASKTFRVSEVRPDGSGMASLLLEEVA